MIRIKNLERIVKISDYSVWAVLFFVVGFIITTELDVNPLLPEINAEIDEETEARLQKLSEMATDLKNIESEFLDLVDLWDDKTISVCDKAPRWINVFADIASFDLKYEVELLDYDKYFSLAKLVGLAYMIECTSYEYHQTHDMLDLILQFQGMKTGYELKYGEI